MDIGNRIAIDPGTSRTRIADACTGEMIDEPTLAAVSLDGQHIEAVGEEAESLFCDLPGKYLAIRSVNSGVITDIDVFEIYIQKMVKKFRQGRLSLLSPKAFIAIPSGMTDMQKSEMRAAVTSGAVRDVIFVEKPLAAALGADEEINGAHAVMVISMGAGLTEAAVICMGRIISYRMINMGGDSISMEISAQIRKSLDVLVGRGTAERLKKDIGLTGGEGSTLVCAKNVFTGLPLTVNVENSKICASLKECLGRITDSVKQMLSGMPNELYADVLTRGILLTGGGARLKGAHSYFENALGLPVRVDRCPENSVIIGTTRAATAFEERRSFFRLTEKELTQT